MTQRKTNSFPSSREDMIDRWCFFNWLFWENGHSGYTLKLLCWHKHAAEERGGYVNREPEFWKRRVTWLNLEKRFSCCDWSHNDCLSVWSLDMWQTHYGVSVVIEDRREIKRVLCFLMLLGFRWWSSVCPDDQNVGGWVVLPGLLLHSVVYQMEPSVKNLRLVNQKMVSHSYRNWLALFVYLTSWNGPISQTMGFVLASRFLW